MPKYMKEYNEEDYLMLSGIQHYVFCRRQWALIHIEQQWEENLRTVEGNIMHERAHDGPQKESRGDIIISRGMKVFSKEMGINGVCDVVEFHKDEEGTELFGVEGKFKVIPIEYKKGEPKSNDADILQLVAQAMCLESMLLCSIERGYLYYGTTKRRVEIEIEEEYRQKVRAAFEEMHQMYDRRHTPKVKTTKSCNACSLKDICMPKLCKDLTVRNYVEARLKEDDS